MMQIIIWAMAALCLLVLLIWLSVPIAAPGPTFDVPLPQPTHGPHTIIASGRSDDGHFILLRTPLYEHPLNAALITQVVFDASGNMTRARYLRVAPLENGKLNAGQYLGRPLTLTLGPGSGTVGFTDDPETTWTH